MNKIKIFNILYISAISIITLFFFSCSKDESSAFTIENYEYIKSIRIIGQDSESSITMLVKSDDESIVNQYSESNFKLTLLKEGEEYLPEDVSNEGDGDEVDIEESKSGIHISFEVEDESVSEKYKSYVVTFIHPDTSDERYFNTYTHYSDYDRVKVIREKTFKRIYASVAYLPYRSSEMWSKLTIDNKKIKKCCPLVYFMPGSYLIKAEIRSKSTSYYSIKWSN